MDSHYIKSYDTLALNSRNLLCKQWIQNIK